jgi:hypothetical protein
MTTATLTSVLGRLDAERSRWRVTVEAWGSDRDYHGRLVFQPEAMPGQTPQGFTARASATLLAGHSPEEVVSAAYDLPEKQIRALLHSLA